MCCFLGKIFTGGLNNDATSYQSHISTALLPLSSHWRTSALLASRGFRGERRVWQTREKSGSQVLLRRRVDEFGIFKHEIIVYAGRIHTCEKASPIPPTPVLARGLSSEPARASRKGDPRLGSLTR